jgi:hypothetical protein
LARCQASGYRDQAGRYYPPDCRAQERALRKAQRDLAEAQAKFHEVREWMKLVEQKVDSYRKQARRLTGLLNEDAPKATSQLSQKIAILQAYAQMSSTTLVDSFSTTKSPAAQGMHQSVDGRSFVEDEAVIFVPISQIDMSRDMDHVKGPGDFHKTSYEEMVAGFRKLQEVVQPAVEKGHDVDYFREMDQELGLDYEHGYQRIYEAFYGDSSIRLEKIGNVYRIINGAHRLWVAKRLNIQNVPARVVEVE